MPHIIFNGKPAEIDTRITLFDFLQKQELEPGMVFALEPKIVLPGVGPLGIENSWLVTTEGVEKLTVCNEEIIEL